MTASHAVASYLFVAVSATLLLANVAQAADPPLPMQTYTFKTIRDLKIQVDVYRADDTTVRPLVVWIHGGALILGSRGGMRGSSLASSAGSTGGSWAEA